MLWLDFVQHTLAVTLGLFLFAALSHGGYTVFKHFAPAITKVEKKERAKVLIETDFQ